MNKPISVGDLVMVVRGHPCVLAELGGVPFVVDAIHPKPDSPRKNWKCSRCKASRIIPLGPYVKRGKANIPLPYLMRIDPPAKQDSVRREEEIAA